MMISEWVDDLAEVKEMVEAYIEGFKEFGSYIKDWDNRGIEEIKKLKGRKINFEDLEYDSWKDAKELLEFYKDDLNDEMENLIWEIKESKDGIGLSGEYGEKVKNLIIANRKIQDIQSNLRIKTGPNF